MVAEQCPSLQKLDSLESFWISICLAVVILSWIAFSMAAFSFWKRLDSNEKHTADLDSGCGQLHDLINDNSSSIAKLATRADETDQSVHDLRCQCDRLDEIHMRDVNYIKRYCDAIRYGLTEVGGFVRYQSLPWEKHKHMFTVERGNLVLQNIKSTPDSDSDACMHEEGGEEESPVFDVSIDPQLRLTPCQLKEHLDMCMDAALERFDLHEARYIQSVALGLASSRGRMPDVTVLESILRVFQNACTEARSDGDPNAGIHYDRAVCLRFMIHSLDPQREPVEFMDI